MRARFSAGLDILAEAARKAARHVSALPDKRNLPDDTQSQAYLPSRRPALQHSAPASRARPSVNPIPAPPPLDSFDIGRFRRELETLRQHMNETALAFHSAQATCNAMVTAERHRNLSPDRAAFINDALTGAMGRLARRRTPS